MKRSNIIIRHILLTAFLLNFLIFNTLNAQPTSVCPIGVGMETMPQSELEPSGFVSEIYFPYFTKWSNIGNIKSSDDKSASISLSKISRSREILGNNFKFQIPTGATINGIRLMVEGQSNDYVNIDEVAIHLIGQDGEPKGQNKKNTAKLQKAWSQDVNGADKTWRYGMETDTWGAQWTAEEINDPNFGFKLQIRSIINDTIDIQIDQIYIIVDYTPAYSFCDAKCLTFYIDKYEQYGSYTWDFPLGFEMVSATTYNQTIDLKITTAEFGLYNICVDIFDYDGEFVERCCRDFLYQNCQSSQIKGLAWQDLNDNQLRDVSEGVLSNLVLILFSENGTPVDTTQTDQLGNYVFSELPAGYFYIKAPTLPDYEMILFNPLNPDINSDISNANGPGTTSLITTEIGKTVENIDFGYTPLIGIGDFVWSDNNYNGLQDTGEPGLGNVLVKLFRENGLLYDSTLTTADGKYQFVNIPANKYYLLFDTPFGLNPTYINPSSTSLNSKIDSLGKTPLYTFMNAGSYNDIDAGYFKFATLGDLIWEDKNGNGLYENDTEEGISGIKLQLTGIAGNGNLISLQSITDGNGRYLFDNILPGVYTLEMTTPVGYYETPANAGTDILDSDFIGGQVLNIPFISGDFNLNIDGGLYRYASIGDFVWIDNNGDGIQQLTEPGIANITLKLFEIFHNDTFEIITTVTDSQGKYSFNKLKPGQYYIALSLPGSYQYTVANVGNDLSDSDAKDGLIQDINLMSGENNITFDAGIYNFGSIGDFVWEDTNGNGIQDLNEPGLFGIDLTLSGISTIGNVVNLSTKTDIEGYYFFDLIPPGTYDLKINLPSGYQFTISNAGSDIQLDSDGINGIVSGIIINSGNIILDVDFGVYALGSVGDFVWEDLNADGIQNTGEPGLPNIEITLIGVAGDGTNITLNTMTDASGYYLFDNLKPGNYTITVNVPSEFEVTPSFQGNDTELDSDLMNGNAIDITLLSGQYTFSIDIGLYKEASIGDFVWEDINYNGLQDIDEPGIEGVSITLSGQTGTGNSVSLSTNTNNNGQYLFSGLIPGNYNITFSPGVGYEFTDPDKDINDTNDSDAINGTIANINVLSGENLSQMDAGLFRRVTVGDFVWEDMNANGIQDIGEPGLENIEITINGIAGNGTTNSKTTFTDASGNYTFNDLQPGSYIFIINVPTDYLLSEELQGNDDQLDSDFYPGNIAVRTLVSGQSNLNVDAGLYRRASIGDFVWEDMNFNGLQDLGEPGLSGVNISISGLTGTGSPVAFNTTSDSNGKYSFTGLIPGIYSIAIQSPGGYEFTIANSGNDDNIDSDGINSQVEDINVLSGEMLTKYDAGLFRTAAIGDFVWEDLNANGIQEIGEPGLENVEIIINGQAGNGTNVSQSTLTDASGHYVFNNLLPGNYTVSINIPNGYNLTTGQQGNDDALDSDFILGNNVVITLFSGQTYLNVDAGLYRLTTIGDFVWDDLNLNGLQDANEPGVEGINIELTGLTGSGSPVTLNTISDNEGNYSFTGLIPGTYSIRFLSSAGYELTLPDLDLTDLLDSDAINGTIDNINVLSGENLSQFDAGFYRRSYIGDFVWEDINGNGLQDTGEPGLKGIIINLTGTDIFGSTVSSTTSSDNNGRYLFANLIPGLYNVTFVKPTNLEFTFAGQGNDNVDSDTNSGLVSNIFLQSGENNSTIDAGFYTNAIIGDRVWEDKNANGIQDMGETGLENITIVLSGTNGIGQNVNMTTLTDNNGRYGFSTLAPGNYNIEFIEPAGYFWSVPFIGNADLDSNADNGFINDVEIKSGDQIDNLDAGVYKQGSIGNFVWVDTNFNGKQDVNEPGLADVRIQLEGIDGQGIPVNLSTISNADGFYNFTNLTPGIYTISATLLTGYTNTVFDITIDSTLNSDGSFGILNNLMLCSGDSRTDIDFGFVKALNVGDFVWDDLNVNGIQDVGEPGISDIAISLSGTSFDGQSIVRTTTTDGLGKYNFSGIFPGNYTLNLNIPNSFSPTLFKSGSDNELDSDLASMTNTLAFSLIDDDKTIDIGLVQSGSIGDLVWEDLNCNGITETGEPGMAGLTVRLEGSDLFNNLVQETTFTDQFGFYLFENLKPGFYTVTIDLPSGYELSPSFINTTSLNSGDNILFIDAPVFRRASLGDYIWVDINENGIQDDDEQGIEGVKITITGTSPTNQISKDTITDINGRYYFDNLKPGVYTLTLEIPQGYESTIKQGTSDQTLDSDLDNDGTIQNIVLLSGNINLDVDAGLINIPNAFIGDFVWEDLNYNGIQDSGEPGLSGITVMLTGTTLSGNNINLFTISDHTGYYAFENLKAGNYTVTFVSALPFKLTKVDIGNDEADSDADPATGQSATITVGANTKIVNIDAGFYRPAFLGDFVWKDLNKNGLQENGEPGIQGIKLRLLDQSNNEIATATSQSIGLYFFFNVIPGIYKIEAEIPSTYLPTINNNSDVLINSDFAGTNNIITTEEFSVFSNQIKIDLDLGLVDALSSISGFAWSDENGNGTKDDTEPYNVGKLVYLIANSGDTLRIDTTLINGAYSFDNLPASEYRVAFETVKDSFFTYTNFGSNPLIDSDVDKLTGQTALLILNAGLPLDGINAGYVSFSSIGNFVWRDDNEDGLQSTEEPGINGIRVILLDSDGFAIDSTITNLLPGTTTGGYYRFDSLMYGNYIVKFIMRDNLRFTDNIAGSEALNSDVVNVADGNTAVILLRPNEFKDDIDAGYILIAPVTGNITGIVWQDINNNKIKDSTENTLPDVTVSLYALNGTFISSVLSGSDGAYNFNNIPFGDYYISVPVMGDKVFVKYSGQEVAFDSDISNDFGPGTTHILTIFPGETLDNIDMGYADKILIGDFVWDDLNNNGLQDLDENGIPNINVTLINEAGNTEATAVSDISGSYIITDVAVGKYRLEFSKPTGYLYALNNNSNQILNSKPDMNTGETALLDFPVSGTYNNIDAGFVKTGKIGDNVWLDLNGNGIFQNGEPGISDIKVTLFSSTGTKISETTTGVDPTGDFVGYYNFSGVRPGNYYIQFSIGTQYIISPPNVVVDDNIDSDLTGLNGPFTTNTFTLEAGQNFTNIDAGAYLPASLGDFVWNDLNNNGAQDINEPGIPDITVKLFTQSGQLVDTKITNEQGKYLFSGLRQRLYYIQFSLPEGFQFTLQYNSGNGATDSDVDATGTTPLISLAHGSTFLDVDAGIHVTMSKLIMGTIWDDRNEDGIRTENEKLQNNITVHFKNALQNIVSTTTTNHAGMYCIKTEVQGNHYVQILSPLSYFFSTKNAGSNPQMDSDVDENGTSDALVLNAQFKLKYVDAGFYYKQTSTLKGMVWIDGNNNGVRDEKDETMPNVVIFLFDKNKVFIKSVKTNDVGLYSFKNLDKGQYFCIIPELPDFEYVMFTGNDQDKDSEITNQYGRGSSRLFTLDGINELSDFDFGYVRKSGIKKDIDDARGVVKLYPNPALFDMTIELPASIKQANYFILNTMGHVIQQGTLNDHSKIIDTEKLLSGKYTIQIVSEKQIWTKPFMKIVN